MARKRLQILVEELEKEENLSKKRLEETRHAFNETAKTARTSWSATGERHYSESQLTILETHYKRLKKIKNELIKASRIKIPDKITTPSFLELILNGKKENFYFLDEPINFSNMKTISPASPLGRAILGKMRGETFSFSPDGKNVFKGEILEIE
ncbi:GreA/GreB family elongation factor [Patescibacteria group bacterium]|nr:GreA/GreB family elongation factor [Patescibacteria group bacterium]